MQFYKFLVESRLMILSIFYLGLSISGPGCKKLVEIPEPVNTLTTTKMFSSDELATSAVLGIYSSMAFFSQGMSYTRGGLTIYTGMSADELNLYASGNTTLDPFQTNSLTSDNNDLGPFFWTAMYSHIYLANAVIEGLENSNEVSVATKNHLTGEAKFFRAFAHFYLVNLFGDIPLVTTTSWSTNSLAVRTPSDLVYDQIINDLTEAQNLLPEDYELSASKRIRVNKYVASALLSRVYLFRGDYLNAEAEATKIIDNVSTYELEPNLSSVFLANSKEALWQLHPSNTDPYAVYEASNLIPPSPTDIPNYYLTSGLLSSFDSADQRRSYWIDSSLDQSSGFYYYYPGKYKIRQGNSDTDPLEYYMVFRLAEQYLIRSEARAKLNKVAEGQNDLNVIRARAGLPNTTAIDEASLLTAIIQERKLELFAEWGHRWFDLKRWGQADGVLSVIKGSTWQSTDELYPIPQSELTRNSSLTQNPGYQ